MSARVDHAARAVALVTPTGALGTVESTNEKRITAAQVHATLALVEQQRTANALEYLRIMSEAGRVDLDEENQALGLQVREALGLS